MHVAPRFWGRAAVWAGLLLAMLLAISLVSGQGVREVIANLPSWAGLAVALAAYPAGVSVAAETFPRGRLAPRRIGEFILAAAVVVVFMFLLGNFVAPRFSQTPAPGGSNAEPVRMSLGELRAATLEAVERARAESGATAERWQAANILVWHYIRRTEGSVLPLLFALIGVMMGYWGSRFSRQQVRQAQYWSMGLFLLVSTYLAGENSFELIVMRAAGPVFFAGDLVLVVPVLLVLGMGWPTFVSLWHTGDAA